MRILGGRSDRLVYSRHIGLTISLKIIQSVAGEAHAIEAIRDWVGDANQYRAKCSTPEQMMKGMWRKSEAYTIIYY